MVRKTRPLKMYYKEIVCELFMKIIYTYYVDNKAKRWISKRVFQENKARQVFRKTKIPTPWYAHVRRCAYQGVRKFGVLCFLETPVLIFVFLPYYGRLLVEIYKSIPYISLPIMWNFFELKRNRYNLRGNYLLKLPGTNTRQYDKQAPWFNGSLCCVIRFQTNIKFLILAKNSRVKSNNGVLLPVAVKFVNREILDISVRDCRKTLLMVLDEFEWIIWLLYMLK